MKKVKEIVLSALEKFWAGLKTKVVLKTNIINNLTSTSTDAPLSANQGKVLKGDIDSLNEKLETTTKVTVTSLCPNNYIVGDQSVYTKNGVCFIWLYVQCIEKVPVTQERVKFALLPQPKRYFSGMVQYAGIASNVEPLGYRLNNDGSLEFIGGENTKYYSLLFSYPIATE